MSVPSHHPREASSVATDYETDRDIHRKLRNYASTVRRVLLCPWYDILVRPGTKFRPQVVVDTTLLYDIKYLVRLLCPPEERWSEFVTVLPRVSIQVLVLTGCHASSGHSSSVV